jgi:hypothetical protein
MPSHIRDQPTAIDARVDVRTGVLRAGASSVINVASEIDVACLCAAASAMTNPP